MYRAAAGAHIEGEGEDGEHGRDLGREHEREERRKERAHVRRLAREEVVDVEEGDVQEAKERGPGKVHAREHRADLVREEGDDAHVVHGVGHADEDREPRERVPRGRVREAVAPLEHARQQQHGEAEHGGDDGGDADEVAEHPEAYRAEERRGHDLLRRRHGAHGLEARRRLLGRLGRVLLLRLVQLRARAPGL